MLLESALEYASRGGPVPPHRPATKLPSLHNGLHGATTNEAIIRRWWDACPTLNIGIRTGAVSGLVVIDLDHKPELGVDGFRSWGDLLHQLCEPYHHTLVVLTPSEGSHLVYGHPGGGVVVPNSAGKLGPGIDVRGDGGYVVSPPSTTDAGSYTLDHPDPYVAPLPESILGLLVVPPTPVLTDGPWDALRRALNLPARPCAMAPQRTRTCLILVCI
jgi:putative DNA primase/helicase